MAAHTKTLKIAQWNCEGLKSSEKFLASSNLHSHDIIVLTETMALRSFNFPGFYSHHCLAVKSSSGLGRPIGGVSVLAGPRVGDLTLIHAADNVVILSSPSLLLVALYSSNASKTGESTEELVDKVAFALSQGQPNQVSVLAGDLNCRIEQSPLSSRAATLIRSLEDLGHLIVSDLSIPTYFDTPRNSYPVIKASRTFGCSTIDIFSTNAPSVAYTFDGYVQNWMLLGTKKHLPVSMTLRVSSTNANLPTRSGIPKKLDHNRLNALGPEADILHLQSLPITVHADYLTAIIRSSTSERPVNRIRRSPRWFNIECFEARRMMMQALQLSRACTYMTHLYKELRVRYRRIVEAEKLKFSQREEIKLLEEARTAPYKWVRAGLANPATCPIPSHELQEHFKSLFAGEDTRPMFVPSRKPSTVPRIELLSEDMDANFSEAEVVLGLKRLKAGKAFGPDLLRNEHLKQCVRLITAFTEFFNRCLRTSTIPDCWKDCILKIIPKGKGDVLSVNSWRGIAKRSCFYKLLSSVITSRLSFFLEQCDVLPPEQHGFRTGRSTNSACLEFKAEIERSLAKSQPLYAVFVDLKSAFDKASRTLVLRKLAEAAVGQRLIGLISSILQSNNIILDDGVCEHPRFSQTTGYAQGDNISPLLFCVLISDLPAYLRPDFSHVKMILYADDIVLASRDRHELQRCLSSFEEYCNLNGLVINTDKTKAMKIRRSGSIRSAETFRVNGGAVEFVKQFAYLGILFTEKPMSFSAHISERIRKATIASTKVRTRQKLSVRTATDLFNIYVSSVLSYGIDVVWKDLTLQHLIEMDKVKARYLKSVLGAPRNSLNRLVYALVGCTNYIEDLVARFNLEPTEALTKFREMFANKMRDIPPEFYSTKAMTCPKWRECNKQEVRFMVIGHALHGYHHKLCKTCTFHTPCSICVCKFCDQTCERYHLDNCQKCPPLSVLVL